MSGSVSTAVSAVHRGSSGRHAAPAPEPTSSTLPGGSSAAQARSKDGPDGAAANRSARRANTVRGSTQGESVTAAVMCSGIAQAARSARQRSSSAGSWLVLGQSLLTA